MRKLLQVLTVLILLLSVGALVMGVMLFNKRELLKGRTQMLEKSVVELSALIETPVDPENTPAAFTEKDIGEVAAALVPEPERASFWTDYPMYLEKADNAVSTIRREDLMHYYKADPITGKPQKDAATGLYITSGDGTMSATLDKIKESAEYELNLLNTTRHQLARVRGELVATIETLNGEKQSRRQALVTIQEQRGNIATLEDDKRGLQDNIATLEGEKSALQDDVAAKEKAIQERDEKIQLQDETIASQRQQIADLKKGSSPGSGYAGAGLIKMEAGQKGRVVSVNADWSYVVLELDAVAMTEIAAMREAMTRLNQPGFPAVEFFLKRGNAYVSKIKLVQIKPEQNLAIADVLTDWQQAAVKTGDVAFF